MKSKAMGGQLVSELLTNSIAFYQSGKGIQLLQEYFEGFPLDTLHPLLSSSDQTVRHVAAWIASELGVRGKAFINDAVSLMNDDDLHIRSYAMDVLVVCAIGEYAEKYMHLVYSLEDQQNYLRVQGMFLMSNSDDSQFEAAAGALGFETFSEKIHQRGLLELLTAHRDPKAISDMLNSSETLLRKYGAIAAWRNHARFPELFSGLEFAADPDLKAFWNQRRPRGKPSVGNQ